jgi:hypothetical protein
MKTKFIIPFIAMLLVGCGTLAPEGPYAGDKTLYAADEAISLSYEVIHSFVLWEFQNREALKSQPEIKQKADQLRQNAPGWFATSMALRDAYADNPTDGTRDALQRTLGVLRAATLEATKYLAAKGTL